MRRLSFFIILIASLLFFFPSCLTVEKKEYHFEFTGQDTGILTINYINIMSVTDDKTDVEKDFEELLNTYIEGDLIENEYRFAKLISKRLYEDKGILCGEVKFEFAEISAVRLFQYEEKSPLMMKLIGTSCKEEYVNSNGNYGGEIMPVVFWPNNTPNLKLTTTITRPDNTCISLLEKYRDWAKNAVQ